MALMLMPIILLKLCLTVLYRTFTEVGMALGHKK